MKTSTDTSSPALVAHSTRATGSGFFVIGRKGPNFYALTDHWKARGYRFDEMWIFGRVGNAEEYALWKAIVPIFAGMDETMIHEIPNAAHQPRRGE